MNSAILAELARRPVHTADGNLTAHVPDLCPQVLAMHLDEPLRRYPGGARGKRHPRVRLVMREALQRIDVSLLQDVGCRDPALQPAIDPELDHPPEPIPVSREQVGQRLLIALLEAVEQLLDIVSLVHRRNLAGARSAP